TEGQLFEAFQRLGDHDNTSGVGLGLSVARGFVEAMGGIIQADETPGGGLTVVVDLPAPKGTTPAGDDAERSDTAGAPPGHAGGIALLREKERRQ
ncbi:MAG: histidine kinase, partial [Mycobacterium sp.]|nr:histidine kinase [Mycobacterium sp.]